VIVKDHVTLKTGVMMINSGINETLLYIHIENRWFTLEEYYTVLLYLWWN